MGKYNCLICRNELKKYNKKLAQAHKKCLDMLMHPPFQTIEPELGTSLERPIMPYDGKIMIGTQLIRRIIDFKLIMDDTGDPVKANFTIHFPTIRLEQRDNDFLLVLGAD